MDLENLKQTIIEKARKDDVFRQSLLDNPKNAIETETQQSLNSNVTINVVEDSAQELTFVLPPKTNGELTDEDLDAVSGGGLLNLIFS